MDMTDLQRYIYLFNDFEGIDECTIKCDLSCFWVGD